MRYYRRSLSAEVLNLFLREAAALKSTAATNTVIFAVSDFCRGSCLHPCRFRNGSDGDVMVCSIRSLSIYHTRPGASSTLL
ncbi:hypothetical protein Scep_023288 [Stephania cephalantha]|uniref:Uncharacterized protein n=1 Tax=Stephania cephalantha TaxID=152367 RepID=A0AAP0EZY1_9MAGN